MISSNTFKIRLLISNKYKVYLSQLFIMKSRVVSNIIDCTFRDGGYYNNWDFSLDLVNQYLKVMSKIGIQYVELGFRSFQSETYKGTNWYTTDHYINSLKIPKNIKIVLMVNASQVINYKSTISKAVRKLFIPKKNSKVYLIRVACYFSELRQTIDIIKNLKKLGYKCAVNLMQISEQNDSTVEKAVRDLKKTDADIIYFADSLGSMNTDKIEKILKIIKKDWKGPVGVHMHNNMEQALNNNIYCLNYGVDWIDTTIMGMGRGAGNASTEHFILEFNKFYNKKMNILPLFNLIKKYFLELKKKYQWGPNPFYFLAGIYGIHPTYIQEMITTNFSNAEILAAIEQLKISGGNKYNVDLVRSEFQTNIKLQKGNWSPKKYIKNKDVLLIASGPKLKQYVSILENYIKKNKPYVIAVNTDIQIKKELINIYSACNPLKIIADADIYKKVKKPIAIPNSLLNKNILRKFKKIKILNFEVGLRQNIYKFYETGAIVPRLYTLVYALAIATSGNSKRILLAGFDGYGMNDHRTKLVNNLIYQYSSSKESKKILAITPTSYSLNYKSIYNLK